MQTAKFSYRKEPELMDRLSAAQNADANQHIDIMTFAALCESRAELERHVSFYETQAAVLA